MTIGAMFWLGLLGWVLYFGACWIAYKAQHLRFWLAWSIVPWFIFIPALMVGAPVPRVVVWLYSYSLPLLPLWWLYRVVARPESRSPQHDNFSDLKPLDPDSVERWDRR